MNKNCCRALSMLALSITPALFTTGWGTESNVNGPDKNKTNIYGTLETWGTDETGTSMKISIDNISFGGIFKDIPVYSAPPASDYDPATRALKVDPTTKYLKVDMHLVDKNDKPKIIEIRVEKPDIVWTYKDPNRSYPEKAEYIEITFKACDGTQRNYLIDTKKKLLCYGTKPPAERMELPLAGIKKLTIEGAKPREDKENCACEVTPACNVTSQSVITPSVPNPIDESTTASSTGGSSAKMPATSGLSTGGSHFGPGMHK